MRCAGATPLLLDDCDACSSSGTCAVAPFVSESTSDRVGPELCSLQVDEPDNTSVGRAGKAVCMYVVSSLRMSRTSCLEAISAERISPLSQLAAAKRLYAVCSSSSLLFKRPNDSCSCWLTLRICAWWSRRAALSRDSSRSLAPAGWALNVSLSECAGHPLADKQHAHHHQPHRDSSSERCNVLLSIASSTLAAPSSARCALETPCIVCITGRVLGCCSEPSRRGGGTWRLLGRNLLVPVATTISTDASSSCAAAG